MRCIMVLLVFTFFIPGQLQGQRSRYSSLKGTVIDSISRQPIEAATVSVYLAADSSLITYTITNKKGEFLVKDIPQATTCLMTVSYSGLRSYTLDFVIAPETKELLINTVQLQKAYAEMEEVVVSAQRPPVMVKKDTLEFNAGSFKTPVNSVVEDLLKQLPGVDVDEAGNITVNGKKVSKIMVDGKDFFTSDLKITSKNLSRDLVDKVQVVDYKTREARFSKTTTGNQEKAINLILKKDKKPGIVGRASAGYGSDRRYEAGANLNSFQGPFQWSFIGYANNTNRMSSSSGNFNASASSGNLAGEGNGIMETKGMGLNVNHQLNDALRLNGSYFYNNGHLTNHIRVRRQNTLPDTSFLYTSDTRTTNNDDAHRLQLNLEYKPDSLTEVNVNAFLNATAAVSVTDNHGITTQASGGLLSTASNAFSSHSNDQQTMVDLFFGRRLHKPGRAFTLTMNYTYNDRAARDGNKGLTTYYTGGNPVADTLDQRSHTGTDNRLFSLSASWTEPISTSLHMVMGYSHRNGSGQADKLTHRFNPFTGLYDIIDTTFSTTFHNRHRAHTPHWSLVYISEKINASIGSGIEFLEQENFAYKGENLLHQYYTNIFPAANITYGFSKTGSMSFNYEGRSEQPSLENLQPVPDNSNPLYIRLGNANLKPSFSHTASFGFQQYSSQNYWNIGLTLGTVSNQVVYENWFDSVQISRPVNSNGNYRLSYNISYSRSWKKRNWSLRLNLSNGGSYNRAINYLNKTENVSHNYQLGQRIALSYTFKELFTVTPNLLIRYTDTRYSLEQPPGTENITKRLVADLSVNWPNRMILEQNIQYYHNRRTAPGFPKGVMLWNMAVNYQLFKNKQGLLRLAINDLLRQNRSIKRTVTPTYVEDRQVQLLQQYFLATFIYTIAPSQK